MTPFTQFIFVVVSFTLLPSAWAQKTLAPSDLCEDNSAADVVTFAYAVL